MPSVPDPNLPIESLDTNIVLLANVKKCRWPMLADELAKSFTTMVSFFTDF